MRVSKKMKLWRVGALSVCVLLWGLALTGCIKQEPFGTENWLLDFYGETYTLPYEIANAKQYKQTLTRSGRLEYDCVQSLDEQMQVVSYSVESEGQVLDFGAGNKGLIKMGQGARKSAFVVVETRPGQYEISPASYDLVNLTGQQDFLFARSIFPTPYVVRTEQDEVSGELSMEIKMTFEEFVGFFAQFAKGESVLVDSQSEVVDFVTEGALLKTGTSQGNDDLADTVPCKVQMQYTALTMDSGQVEIKVVQMDV